MPNSFHTLSTAVLNGELFISRNSLLAFLLLSKENFRDERDKQVLHAVVESLRNLK